MTGQGHPPCLLIVADDLTGAADCAARCRHAGLDAAIYLAPPDHLSSEQVHAVSTDTRHLAAGAAGEIVLSVVTELAERTADVDRSFRWYKKIDSTLRGNIGAELDATLDALWREQRPFRWREQRPFRWREQRPFRWREQRPFRSGSALPPNAIVCPAFPAQKRGLHNGFLVFANAAPNANHLPTLLDRQSRHKVATVPLAVVRGSASALQDALTDLATGHQIIVADAINDADLTTLVAAVTHVLPSALLVGSAGMIGTLAEQIVERWGPVHVADNTASGDTFPVLVIVGSGSKMAHRQISALAAQPDVTRIQLEHNQPFQSPAVDTVPHVLLLHLPPPGPDDALEGPQARYFAAALSNLALEVLHALQPRRIILVGGDTTIQVLRRLQVQKLTVLSEVLPGMPLATSQMPDCAEISFILKAGNHGSESTLVELVFGVR